MKRNGIETRRSLVLAGLAVLVAGLAPRDASGHDLKATVDPAGDPIRVVVGFDDDTPADGARVAVTDSAGTVIAAGLLDDRGMWSFPRPGPGRYEIVVESAGHRDAVVLTIAESEPAAVEGRWRLDKDVGLTAGVILLLGGTGVYLVLRRRRQTNIEASGRV